MNIQLQGIVFVLVLLQFFCYSKKQQTVFLSSMEAEYVATTRATQEYIWSKRLLPDIGFVMKHLVPVSCDNQKRNLISEQPSLSSSYQTHKSRSSFFSWKVLNKKYCRRE